MKTVIFILAAALLCGCNKKWEYKVVEFRNSEGIATTELFLSKTNSTHEWLTKLDEANSSAGLFSLEMMPPIAGIKGNTTISPDLDTMGKEGWELVAAVPQIETIAGAKFPDGIDYSDGKAVEKQSTFSNTRTASIFLIFKRQK
jgi:hypothetical protein